MAKDLSKNDAWKRLLQEPNAIGWIAFLILVVSIGVGTIIFDRGGSSKSRMDRTAHTAPHVMK